ncbi:hypothetical protein [Nonomuraea sp. NPDC023979]|uniref:hypothetical protein n=1 Tax=Nonomuraea sp. NPDC023979 TaxID=3154796 RepID=UPI0033CA8654
MTRSLLLVSLAAGALTVPAPASSAATELAIREITVRPAAPVVGAGDSVRLVIDVVAKGVRGRDGVTVTVEPGSPPAGAERPSPPGRPRVLAPDENVTEGGADALPPAQAVQENPARPGTADGTSNGVANGAADRGADGADAARPGEGAGRPATEAGRPGGEAGGPGVDAVRSGAEAVRSAAETVRTAAGAFRPQVVREEGAEGRPGVPVRLVWRLAPSPMRMSGGWQTWRFLPDKELTRFYPAGTWTITATAKGAQGASVTAYETFQLRRETRLSDVAVERSRHAEGVRLHGSLKRADARGLTGLSPFGGQRVELLWRQSPSGEWAHAGYVTTDAKGSFTHTVRDRTGGFWRVRYAGTGHYAPDQSKIHEIAG